MDTNDLPAGFIQFYDNFIPPLHDGSYTISVQQTLGGGTTGAPSPAPVAPATVSRSFYVSGPRFQIDPAEIHSQFPPPNHSGQFEEQLPHIVLNKRTLPWERYLDASQTTPDEKTPWMALLVFDAGSGATATATVSSTGAVSLSVPTGGGGSGYEIAPTVRIAGGGGTGATALATIDAAGSVTGFVMTNPGSGYTSAPRVTLGSPTQAITVPVSQVLAPGNDAAGNPILGPAITLSAHDDPALLCRAIDVSVAAFSAGAPRYVYEGTNELATMAHVRQVDTGSKEPLGMAEADGWFSVLVAKRFPRSLGAAPNQAPNPQIAHLVSLEGFASLLGSTPAFGASQMVRLVSLASWTFTCEPLGSQSFSALAAALTTTENGTSYLLKQPYDRTTAATADPSALAHATGALDLGYVPLGYQTREGESTFAWYRGPLAPVVTPPIADDPPLSSGSQAAIYDPTWGVFDQSLATAWQTGRSLALADPAFTANLLAWRRTARQLVNLLVERLPLSDVAALKGLDAAAARQLLEQDIVSQQFMRSLTTTFPQWTSASGSTTGDMGAFPTTSSPPATSNSTIADLKNVLADPDIQTLLQELGGYDAATHTFTNSQLQQLCEWLAAQTLLYGVPFNNLVPSAGMLPQNSIRFFYLDRNVTHAMIDGAMSLGAQSQRDSLYYAIMRDVIRQAVQALIFDIRYELLGQTAPAPDSSTGISGSVAGFLLRSQLVSGWPGLEIKAFSDMATVQVEVSTGGELNLTVKHGGSGYSAARPPSVVIVGGAPGFGAAATATVNTDGEVTAVTVTAHGSGYTPANPPQAFVEPTGPIPLLRMDRLSPGVLLCLFPEVPCWIQLDEPREGLAFGVEDPIPVTGGAQNPIYLRNIAGDEVGAQFGADTYVDASPFIDASTGLVDLLGLKAKMEANTLLQQQLAGQTSEHGALRPADFALQMVKLPERMIFPFQSS